MYQCLLGYKPKGTHIYFEYSSSHPSHVKNFMSFSQFLILRRLYSDDSDSDCHYMKITYVNC